MSDRRWLIGEILLWVALIGLIGYFFRNEVGVGLLVLLAAIAGRTAYYQVRRARRQAQSREVAPPT